MNQIIQTEPPVKRPRGRPRKNPLPAENVLPKIKKPVGRPRADAPRDGEFQCPMCRKIFVEEVPFMTHYCEAGRRFRARNDIVEKQAFQWFCQFYKRRMNGAVPTEEKFESSKLYTFFVRFARYIRQIHAVNPPGFVDFLITREVKIADWEKPTLYETYVREWNKSETPTQAMQRNFLLMEQWGIENNEHWTDYFRKVSPSQAILQIISGRLSPWILFTAGSANELLSRFNDEQTKMLEKSIDANFWKYKLEANAAEIEIIRQVMDEINL